MMMMMMIKLERYKFNNSTPEKLINNVLRVACFEARYQILFDDGLHTALIFIVLMTLIVSNNTHVIARTYIYYVLKVTFTHNR